MSEKAKDSGVSWVGEIPEGWGVKRFKYFFETSKGLSITKENLSDSGIPVISYGQIHSKYGRKIDSTKDLLPFVSKNYLKYKQALLNKGDYIFADTSEDIVGSGNFSTKVNDEGKLFAGYHTVIARLLDKENNEFRYFMYLFDSEWFRNQIRNSISGVKVFSITQTILKNTTILIPSSLKEQKAIADYLDEKTSQIDQISVLVRDEISRLRDYKKSLIYETVTKGLDKKVALKDSGVDWIGQIPEEWEVKPIKYIFTIVSSGTTPKSDREDFYDGEFSWIQSGDLYQTDEVIKTSKTLSEIGKKSSSALTTYEAPFLAVAMYGASIGNLAISKIDASVNQAVAVLKDEEVKVRFGKYALIASKAEIINEGLGGTQPNISQVLLKSWYLPQPNLIEQKVIADYLDEKTKKIEKIIKIKEHELKNLSEQRKALIYEAVTGKRRV